MSRLVVALAALVAFVLPAASARALDDDEAAIRADIAVTRALIQGERKAVMRASLPLDANQPATFWPMYDSYRSEANRLGDRVAELILSIGRARENGTFTEAKAEALLAEWLDIQRDEAALKTKWVKRFRRQFPASLVAFAFQLENKMDALLRAELAEGVALVPPVDR